MFFNFANLDTKLMVAILGQDCSLVIQPFRFPTLFSLYPPLCDSFRNNSFTLFILASEDGRSNSDDTYQYNKKWLTRFLQSWHLLWSSVCSLLSHLFNLPCSLIVDRSFQIRIAFASDCVPIHWKLSNVLTTSCHGLHHTQSDLLLASRSTCLALWFSLRKECSHFSLPIYWRRETEQTQTGLDTSGSVDHSSMNFVDQMPTRRSSTGSKISIQSSSNLANLNVTCGVYCLASCLFGRTLPLSMAKPGTNIGFNFLYILSTTGTVHFMNFPDVCLFCRGGFLSSNSALHPTVCIPQRAWPSLPPKQVSKSFREVLRDRACT